MFDYATLIAKAREIIANQNDRKKDKERKKGGGGGVGKWEGGKVESRTERIGQRLWIKGQMDRHDYHIQNSERGGERKGAPKRTHNSQTQEAYITPCVSVCM